MYTVEICHLYQFNKTLVASSQSGIIDEVTRLREFWEEERQRISHWPDTEEAKRECFTEKWYQAMWLNIDKNYGLI